MAVNIPVKRQLFTPSALITDRCCLLLANGDLFFKLTSSFPGTFGGQNSSWYDLPEGMWNHRPQIRRKRIASSILNSTTQSNGCFFSSRSVSSQGLNQSDGLQRLFCPTLISASPGKSYWRRRLSTVDLLVLTNGRGSAVNRMLDGNTYPS